MPWHGSCASHAAAAMHCRCLRLPACCTSLFWGHAVLMQQLYRDWCTPHKEYRVACYDTRLTLNNCAHAAAVNTICSSTSTTAGGRYGPAAAAGALCMLAHSTPASAVLQCVPHRICHPPRGGQVERLVDKWERNIIAAHAHRRRLQSIEAPAGGAWGRPKHTCGGASSSAQGVVRQ